MASGGFRRPGPGKRWADDFMEQEATLAFIVAQAGTFLWIIAAVLVIAGIVSIVRGQMVAGIILIVLGLLVGPGGVSIFG
jgi:hypothetical protein